MNADETQNKLIALPYPRFSALIRVQNL